MWLLHRGQHCMPSILVLLFIQGNFISYITWSNISFNWTFNIYHAKHSWYFYNKTFLIWHMYLLKWPLQNGYYLASIAYWYIKSLSLLETFYPFIRLSVILHFLGKYLLTVLVYKVTFLCILITEIQCVHPTRIFFSKV